MLNKKIINVNKNKKNKNKPYKTIRVLDIKIVKQVIEYRYYQNEDGIYSIPKCHNRAIQWGPNLKTICDVLNNNVYNSTDGIIRFISNITNKGIELSKSTIIRWNNSLANNLAPEIFNIRLVRKLQISNRTCKCVFKKIKIISTRFRNRRKNFKLFTILIFGIYNFKIANL